MESNLVKYHRLLVSTLNAQSLFLLILCYFYIMCKMQVVFGLGFHYPPKFQNIFFCQHQQFFFFFLLTICHGYLVCFSINPLTPELYPSEQCCLLGFFTGDFKFYFLVLGGGKHIS